MIEQISDEIKSAMKAKDKAKLSALRMLKSSLLENSTAPQPKEPMDVVISHHKKLKSSLDMFPEGNPQRADLEAEIKFIEVYLPKALSEGEVADLIQAAITELGSPAFGDVMKKLSPQIKGRFDSKQAVTMVKTALS